jgi:hypothetical protein
MAVVDDFDLDSVSNAVNSAFGRKSAPPAKTQSSREQEALRVLQAEYERESKLAAGGNAASARNLEALQREMKLKGGAPTTAQTPSDDFSIDAIGAAVQDAFKTAKTDKPVARNKTDQAIINLQKSREMYGQMGRDFGASAASLADTTIGGILPMAGQVVQAASRPFTTPEKAQQYGQAVSGALEKPFGKTFGVTQSPAYQGEASQRLMNFIGENVNKGAEWIAQKTGLPLPDVQNMMGTATIAAPALLAKPLATVAKPLVKGAETVSQWGNEIRAGAPSQLEQQFQARGGKQSAGAAATEVKTQLDAAIAQAKPELAADLKLLNPAETNIEAINRLVDADSLDVPVRLTRGQASQNPSLISRERNERGFKEQFVDRFNEQNKALKENVTLVKERAAPDVFAPDYVSNAQGAIEQVREKIDAFKAEKQQAYKDLADFGAGKLEVDSKTFAQNAMNALTKNEDIDFLPPTIKTKVDQYIAGKPMNFDQFQNLATQIARETRKAQKADDGNAVYALGLVRNELESLPLIGETAEAKVFADKARGLAKREFDLIDKNRPTYNSVYAMVENGGADTKNFIQNNVFSSKNQDFAKMIDLVGDNPQAIQNLRAGTLDYMLRNSTDASGNFLTGKFAKTVADLDVNKKLDALFGAEEASRLRKIANAGTLIEARPKGAFVNESNTTVSAGQLAKDYVTGVLEDIPVVGSIVKPATNLYNQSKFKKEMKESLRPAAGTKLSDVGKPQTPVKIDLSGMAKKD